MARYTADTTRKEILQVAMRMFLDKGFSNTSVKAISEELNISIGNLTFHYPTKEHLLAKLVEVLCEFQREMMDRATYEGRTTLMALCIELAVIGAISEEDAAGKDFYLAAYKHAKSLELIRKSDEARAKIVFAEWCATWDENMFRQTENIVSGIEYSVLMNTDDSSLEDRIKPAMNAIMLLYNVPEELRKSTIQKVLAMDYIKLGRDILTEFKEYISKE